MDEGDDFPRQAVAGFGRAGSQDGHFAGKSGVVDPMVEAAAFQRVMNFAGAVRGENYNRRLGRTDRSKFGDCHLEIGKSLKKKGLERRIGAVDLVDQKHRGTAGLWAHSCQERAFDKIIFGKKFGSQGIAVGVSGRFGRTDGDHLGCKVPITNR